MSSGARQQAQAERLTLVVAKSNSGYFGGYLANPGKDVSLGYFATAEAALCVAQSPEGQAMAAARAAAALPLKGEETLQQAQAEKLTLLVVESKTGYFGVYLANPGRPKPYLARVSRGGATVRLGYFATAEEAALCVARSPEGQAAAEQAAAATRPLTSEAEGKGAFVKEFKEEGWVPPMPPDAFVKVEVVVKEEGSDGRPTRQRTK